MMVDNSAQQEEGAQTSGGSLKKSASVTRLTEDFINDNDKNDPLDTKSITPKNNSEKLIPSADKVVTQDYRKKEK
jgi:hypothetical protein